MDKTIFFPEGGGQSSDIGYFYKLGNTGIPAVKVIDVKENDEFPLHRIAATDEQGELPEFTKGERLLLKIDWAHRFDNMQRHRRLRHVSRAKRFDKDAVVLKAVAHHIAAAVEKQHDGLDQLDDLQLVF